MTKLCLLCKKELTPYRIESDMIYYKCADCDLEQDTYIPEKQRDKSGYKQGELLL
jgi:hypothetical protein